MKHSLIAAAFTFFALTGCGHEESSSTPSDSSSSGSASLSISLDSDGNIKIGSWSHRGPRLEIGLGDGRTSSSNTNREFGFSSSREKMKDRKYKDNPDDKDPLARNGSGRDHYSDRDDIPEPIADTSCVIGDERYPSLEDAEKSFNSQLQSASEGITKAWHSAKPFIDQVKPMLSTAAFAHNDDIHRTLSLTANAASVAADYAGSFKTGRMTAAGAKLAHASNELKKAWKELPNRFNGRELGYRSSLLKAAGSAIDVADVMFSQGEDEQGEYLLKVGLTIVDAALGFVPVVGWVKDVVEASSGYNLVLQRPLTDAERAMAVVGAVTGGLGSQVIATGKTLKAINAFFVKSGAGDQALQAVIKASQMLGH